MVSAKNEYKDYGKVTTFQ